MSGFALGALLPDISPSESQHTSGSSAFGSSAQQRLYLVEAHIVPGQRALFADCRALFGFSILAVLATQVRGPRVALWRCRLAARRVAAPPCSRCARGGPTQPAPPPADPAQAPCFSPAHPACCAPCTLPATRPAAGGQPDWLRRAAAAPRRPGRAPQLQPAPAAALVAAPRANDAAARARRLRVPLLPLPRVVHHLDLPARLHGGRALRWLARRCAARRRPHRAGLQRGHPRLQPRHGRHMPPSPALLHAVRPPPSHPTVPLLARQARR